jgi:two-component system, sensor histidine kinase
MEGSIMAQELSGTVSRPKRILVVEDNKDGRESLRTLLTICGGVVETAADGPEGVRKGLEMRPDIAFVDIGLPGLNGFQVASQLRRALGSQVFIIAHTAYADDARAAKAGFDAWLVKPVKLGEWLHYLRRPNARESGE